VEEEEGEEEGLYLEEAWRRRGVLLTCADLQHLKGSRRVVSPPVQIPTICFISENGTVFRYISVTSPAWRRSICRVRPALGRPARLLPCGAHAPSIRRPQPKP
jgi:hypothetical protein